MSSRKINIQKKENCESEKVSCSPEWQWPKQRMKTFPKVAKRMKIVARETKSRFEIMCEIERRGEKKLKQKRISNTLHFFD
jgi:hypothetical protein